MRIEQLSIEDLEKEIKVRQRIISLRKQVSDIDEMIELKEQSIPVRIELIKKSIEKLNSKKELLRRELTNLEYPRKLNNILEE